MLNSAALEIGVGLIFIYLILALVCSAINEHIARVFSLRADTLWAAVRNMLNDPTGTGIAAQVYNHQLIRSHCAKDVDNAGQAQGPIADRAKPSYLSGEVFAAALLHLAAPDATSAVAANRPQPGAAVTAQTIMAQIEVSKLPDDLKQALRPLLATAGSDLVQARKAVEGWYNSAMDRASGWYRQKMQVIGLVVALLVAWAANADTVMIAGRLWRDPATRAQIATQAQQTAATSAGAPSQTALAATDGLLGWSSTPGDPRRIPTGWGWLQKIAGILITAFAASLGAPFWFDALRRIASLKDSATQQAPNRQPLPQAGDGG